MNWHTSAPQFDGHDKRRHVTLVTKPHETLPLYASAAAMNKPLTPNRWFAGWRLAEREPQDDPADLGTAFGLDLSMQEGLPVVPQAKAVEGDAPGRAQRWSVRRKPAV